MKAIYILCLFFISISSAFSQFIVDFKADTTVICEGTGVQFTDLTYAISNPIDEWFWEFGDSITDTVQNPIHTYADAGTYTITLTTSNATSSNTAIKTNYILVREMPVIDFTYSDLPDKPFFLIVFYGIVTNNDANTYNYSWLFPGDSAVNDNDTVYNIFQSQGQHSVSFIVDAGKNCIDTITKTIDVTDSLEVPNVFTPNGDNINDIFEFRTNGVTAYELTIYNRWGAIIYTITAKRPYWDGYSSAGVKMPVGNYFFVLKAQGDAAYEKAGVVVLR